MEWLTRHLEDNERLYNTEVTFPVLNETTEYVGVAFYGIPYYPGQWKTLRQWFDPDAEMAAELDKWSAVIWIGKDLQRAYPFMPKPTSYGVSTMVIYKLLTAAH